MTPLEKIQSMKMPFAELKGVTFTEAGQGSRGGARCWCGPISARCITRFTAAR